MTFDNWEKVVSETSFLTSPVHFPSFISLSEVQAIHHGILESVKGFCAKSVPFNGLKIFIDRIQANQMNEQLVHNPPVNDESLDEWGQRIFEGRSFGLIMNFLEEYDNELVEIFGTIAHPLIELEGMPLSGLSMLFFMGNYGFTPFGVHRGTQGEDGFLFHLGPEEKIFYTWETEEFIKLTGGTNSFHQVEEILPAAKKHVLSPGDMMFITSDVYHIADTPKFSASLVLDYRKPSNTQLKKTLIERLRFSNTAESLVLNSFRSDSQFDVNNLFKTDLEFAFEAHMKSLKSNAGFMFPSLLKNDRKIPDIITWNSLFPIEYLITDQWVYVFVRGHELKFPMVLELIEIIESLNAGETLSVEDIEKRLSTWEQSDVFQFVIQIHQLNVRGKKETLQTINL